MALLSEKVAIVIGAAAPRGIGRAIARRLASEGAHVVVTDIAGKLPVDGGTADKLDLLHELAAEMEAQTGAALSLELDVTDPVAVSNAVGRILHQFGQIDILVNNAGSLAGAGDFLTTTPSQWETSFKVNLLGPMQLSQTVIPEMRQNGGGRIINIGSTGSLGAEAGFGAYTAMKHALAGMTKTLAAEFGPDGILCNTVCPGFINTDMHEAANFRLAKEHGIPVTEMKSQRYAAVALRDAGKPEDVAEAVAFLAGPGGAYVTGVNFPVAGGVPVGL